MSNDLYLEIKIKDDEKDKENHYQFCPECSSKLIFQEGCVICLNCGWSACS